MSEEKIDKIVDAIHRIDVTLVKNTVILDEHVKRANIQEKKIGLLETKIESEIRRLDKDLGPVRSWPKFLVILTTIISLVTGLVAIISRQF